MLEAEHQVRDLLLDREVKAELVAVLVTGYPDELSVLAREAINEDAYALLRKPFDIEDVPALVREASKE